MQLIRSEPQLPRMATAAPFDRVCQPHRQLYPHSGDRSKGAREDRVPSANNAIAKHRANDRPCYAVQDDHSSTTHHNCRKAPRSTKGQPRSRTATMQPEPRHLIPVRKGSATVPETPHGTRSDRCTEVRDKARTRRKGQRTHRQHNSDSGPPKQHLCS
jgi:hypothetical protein